MRTVVFSTKAYDRDNRLNYSARRSEPVRLWSCAGATVEVGRPQGFQHGGSREDVEGHGAEWKMGFACSALRPYSVALDVLPASSVLRFFLDCGQHMVSPVVGSNDGIQAIALGL